MSVTPLRFSEQRSKGYNIPKAVSQLDRRLTKLETHVNSTMPHLPTKDDLNKALNQAVDGLRSEIKEEVGKLDKKIGAVRAEVENARTENREANTKMLEKQSESVKWLLMTTITLIGVIVGAASYFSGKETQVVYASPPVPQQSAEISVNIISELNELRSLVMDIKQATETKAEREQITSRTPD